MLIARLSMQQLNLLYRFAIFMDIAYPILIVDCYKARNKYRHILLIFIYAVLFLLFYKALKINSVEHIPYQSIFFHN